MVTRTNKLNQTQKDIRRTLLTRLYNNKLSHIGSCLVTIDIIEAIYQIKKEEDIFVLSSGHSGISLYTVMQHHKIISANKIDDLCIHPDRNLKNKIYVSSGSLGQGLPIAVGIALASRSKRVFCLISDGECAEGSIWEALRVAREQQLSNLTIILNANGYGAYGTINLRDLVKRIKGFGYSPETVNGQNIINLKNSISKIKTNVGFVIAKTNSEQFKFLKGIDAHYYVMNEEDYKLAMNQLK